MRYFHRHRCGFITSAVAPWERQQSSSSSPAVLAPFSFSGNWKIKMSTFIRQLQLFRTEESMEAVWALFRSEGPVAVARQMFELDRSTVEPLSFHLRLAPPHYRNGVRRNRGTHLPSQKLEEWPFRTCNSFLRRGDLSHNHLRNLIKSLEMFAPRVGKLQRKLQGFWTEAGTTSSDASESCGMKKQQMWAV